MGLWSGWIMLPEGKAGGDIVVKCNLHLKNRQPDGSYEVTMTDGDLEMLDPFWGQAVWGLQRVE